MSQNFAVPLGQLTYYVGLICLGVLTFYKIRRYWYELFYYVHVTFVPVLILVVLWHATMSWYYLIGGLVLYTADVIIRLTTNVTTDVILQDLSVVVRSSQVDERKTAGGVVSLSYTVNSRLGLIKLSPDADSYTWQPEGKPLCHEMGQYCFLNLPDVDLMEWHPFTISSAPVDGVTTHHIKAMGDTEWTGRLYTLAQELDSLQNWEKVEKLRSLRVAIDGPYGVPLRVSEYTHILMVAGGIGVTPLMAVFRQLYLQVTTNTNPLFAHLRSIRLVWIMRTPSEIATCLDTVCQRFVSSALYYLQMSRLCSYAECLAVESRESFPYLSI
jgi:predicted ferric reductase